MISFSLKEAPVAERNIAMPEITVAIMPSTQTNVWRVPRRAATQRNPRAGAVVYQQEQTAAQMAGTATPVKNAVILG